MFDNTNFKYTHNDYNLLLDTDSYKASHWKQYPPNTQQVFSYVESRGGKYDKTVFFGLQYYIKEFLTRPITQENIWEAEEVWAAHGEPFNKEGWEYILNEHGGYLPVKIMAIPEGLVVPTSHYMASVINTDEKSYWLPSHLETGLLRACWYGTTVSTQSYTIKQIIKKYMSLTASEEAMSSIDFRLHDFGARGVSSYESSGIGDMAHLVHFKGTDTIQGPRQARKYYNEPMAGFSVPASEHSSMTTWGRDNEEKAYSNMISQFGGRGKVVSIVVDSYDTRNAVKNILGRHLHWIIEESGMTLVVRPDSGVPKDIVLEVVELMAEAFGHTVNSKGYKVIWKRAQVLQGDGIDEHSIEEIYANLIANGYSAENVLFGMGGALLQGINRDTLKFAMKCSAAMIDGEWIDVFKDPITDQVKKSKKGYLTLYQDKQSGEYITDRIIYTEQRYDVIPELVYLNGKLMRDMTFAQVRENALR